MMMLFAPAIAAQSFGDQSFTEYEGYLHPAQEADPDLKVESKGYGRLKFPRNLSSGQVDVQVMGVDPANITAFHIHCGAPGVLGPIIVDFSQFGDLKSTLKTGKFSATVVNKGLTFVKQAPLPPKPGSGKLTLPLPEGCPSDINFPVQQVQTIAGLEALARKGALYFNLHTKGHEFYGELRGQIYPAETAH
ncbi:MAG: CHRD domain-containing protein [Alkalinema sp. RU_4_3]|nr:CHRD domain-containing protein [Alkalinema sp. RU_4_3]